MLWIALTAFFISGTSTLSKPNSKISTKDYWYELWRHYREAYSQPLYYIAHLWFVCATVIFFEVFNFSWTLLVMGVLAYVLMVISWSDMRYKQIPDAGVLLIGILAVIRLLLDIGEPLSISLAGAAALGVPTLLVNVLNKEAIGLGDVKLLAATGLFFGLWDGLLLMVFSLILSAFAGLVLLAFKRVTKKTAIPFAPFLSLALIVLYYFYLG